METPEFTGQEWAAIGGAVFTQLRYVQRQLDRAKEPDAVNGWASQAVVLRRIMSKLQGTR